ncbi:MAG: aminopeptidase P family protein [Bacteroidaceae bacterium]|nr:aminopeptidase P family protein [Bacteroidaceae bacterium]
MKDLTPLRTWLREHGLAAFIFPSTDPHSGEYVPDHWKTREWISGFNGSAGTAIVTLDDAALWTDSRYFLAAEEQLQGTPFRLMKEKVPGTPTISEWLGQVLPKGSTVGVDGNVNTLQQWRQWMKELNQHQLALSWHEDPASELWKDRPALPSTPIEIQPIEYAGEEARHKIQRVRKELTKLGVSGTFITQLDDIAWLTNLRGTDVHCCPLFVSYMLVTDDEAFLYVNPDKVSEEVGAYLKQQGITLKSYFSVSSGLSGYLYKDILIDPACTNVVLPSCVPNDTKILEHSSLIAPMKAIKNEVEIAGYRNAMRRDGVALVKFLRWLKPAVEAGGETEMSIDRRLTDLRRKQPLFRDISFDTIAGYAAHGAIVHYEATLETDAPLQPRGLLLLDSGAQYQDGTTDITRTIALGPLTEEECIDYTLVLKGHIRLAMAKFPAGSSGTQLDVLARYAMWQHGLNYLHGTGHGVGSYLNVHEGPHQIRMNYMPTPLVAGMTVTNEPGIYKAGSHGCRTENTQLITHYCDGEFGEFLQFEPLTLCPIDTTPIRRELMLPDELDWLNQYHQHVYDELSPLLDDEADRQWLREATRPISK